MPQPNLIQSAGGAPQKQTRYTSLFTSRFINGLYTNRSALRGPLDSIYSDFYKMGSTDACIGGLNSELTARLTMARRPGNPKYSTASTAAAVDSFFSFRHSNGSIEVVVDTTTDVEVLTPSSRTSIFTKAASAGQGYFEGVDGTMYIGDGVDTVKYIPGTTNPITGKPIWNWQGAAPTVAPTLNVVEAGNVSVTWQANTWFSTMGILIDSNGNAQQLLAVNNSGSQFGMSGAGQPTWINTSGSVTSETSGVQWENAGPIIPWAPNTSFSNYSTPGAGGLQSSCCYDEITGCVFANSSPSNASGTTGASRPNFVGIPGVFTYNDGSLKSWFCLGNANTNSAGVALWAPSKTVVAVGGGGTINNSFCIQPVNLPTAAGQPLPTQTIYLMRCNTGGTTSATYTNPNWATSAGNTVVDNQLVWICLGGATWASTTNYLGWTSSTNAAFSVVKDSHSILQVCIQGGTSGGSNPFTNSATDPYGTITIDGTAQWVNVGPATHAVWNASKQYYLPKSGFNAPSSYDPFGGAGITDGTNSEFCTQTGLSGGSAPSWNATVGGSTTDNQAIWYNNGPPPANSFSWTAGHGYCYAYKARETSDVIVTTAPPLVSNPLGAPTGCGDGSVTTASPVTQINGSNAGAAVTISGPGSTDPQYDTVMIFRSADGFQASGPYLYLTEIPMPAVVSGIAGTWKIQDYMPDKPTATLPGLNPLIEAPVDNANDPPPGAFGSTQFTQSGGNTPTIPATGTALQGVVYHQGRLFGFIGSTVYCSGGPDTNPGNGFTAWPPTQAFPFQSQVVRLYSTTAGLIVFTTTDVCFIGGGPSIASYYPDKIGPGIGILSWNAVTTIAGIPYIFTSDRQILGFDPNGGITRVGHPIGDKLAAYNPANVYLTYHSFGDLDHALFIANGSSEWYRCDLNMSPDGKYTGPVWSPRATISGGFQAIQSIETSPGIHQLLVGPTGAGFVLARDSTFATFTDNTSPYSSYFTMGAIVLAHPGQMAETAFIEMDFMQVGTQPTISVLLDELPNVGSPTFEAISTSFVSDPPNLYGDAGVPTTLWMNRYYFSQTVPGQGVDNTPLPAWCKFLSLKVDFGSSDTIQNELIAFSIFGALWQEK